MKRRFLFLILPILLILSASVVFYLSSITFGKYQGYLIGFVFYWVFWCLLVPYIVNRKSIFEYFKNNKALFVIKNWWVIILFLSTVISPIFMYFLPNLNKTSILLIVFAIPLAIINGFSEELFWRGFYIKEFENNVFWGILIPSILFALWHFVPQIIFPHDNRVAFVISTFFLGLTNGIIAYTTKSAKWSAIGHCIGGILAFGGPVSYCFVKIIS